MAIHWIRIIEAGHFSTQRLFELGSSFAICKQKRQWPSLETINSFLMAGEDDGALGTSIEWEPCTISQEDYEKAVVTFMAGEPFSLDSDTADWNDWYEKLTG
jgi:hypothetical protein